MKRQLPQEGYSWDTDSPTGMEVARVNLESNKQHVMSILAKEGVRGQVSVVETFDEDTKEILSMFVMVRAQPIETSRLTSLVSYLARMYQHWLQREMIR